MRRLLISLLTLGLILFAIDRVVGHALAARFRAAPSDEADAIGRGIAARAPLLICGSSRARHHYDTDTLSARLGLEAWNFGRDGQFDAYYPFGVAALVLRHYTPRVWILEVEDMTIGGPDHMASLNVLLPYANQNPAVAELVNRRSRYERLKRLSRIYPYNSLVLALYDWRATAEIGSRRGYGPLDGQLAPEDTVAEPASAGELRAPAPNSLKLRYLKAMVDSLERRGVSVLAVRGPEFARAGLDLERERAEKARLEAALRLLGVPLLDFCRDACPELGEARYFRDRTHLNRLGAGKFSALLADSILARHLVGPPGSGPPGR
jgi:hypothetical protein